MAKPRALKLARPGKSLGDAQKPDVAEFAKGSRLVRYPTSTNAMRALLNDAEAQSVTLTATSRPGRLLSLGDRPSPSERSKPSPNAIRLIDDLLGSTNEVQARPRPERQRPFPQIQPATVRETEDFGEMIRLRRLMLKLSQQQLADKAGLGRRFVGELEAGKSTVELGKTLAACRALGLTLTLQASDAG